MNNYIAKDSIIRNNSTIDGEYQKALIDYYRFEYLSTSIECIFRKLKDTASINKELYPLLSNFRNTYPIYTKSYRSSIKSLVTGYSFGAFGTNVDSIVNQRDRSLTANSKDFALFYFTNIQQNKDQSLFQKTYQKSKPLIADSIYLQYLENIDKILQLTKSLDDIYVNQTGSILLEEILKQNSGKYIILDFTASWCAPCITSIPITQKLAKEYSKDVAFVYISIDNDINKWNKAIIDNQIAKTKAYHLVKGTKSLIAKKYGINSIPRYMIFNRKGQLIDQNAPSALEGELEKKIITLLR